MPSGIALEMEVLAPDRKGNALVKPDASPLDFLKAVYTNEEFPLPARMKAAIEAAQYVHPRLQAVIQGNMGDRFADQLDRAIAASNAARQEPKMIEAQVTNGHHHRSPEEVSTERMGKSFSPLRRRF